MDSNINVVIVDGTTTAMLASVIFKDKEIDHLILEQKQVRGNEVQWIPLSFSQLIIEMLLSKIKVKNRYVLSVPCIFYDRLSLSDIKGVIHLIKAKKKVYDLLKYYLGPSFKEYKYYGAITSTIISFINEKNIIHLDHGCEYFLRNETKSWNLKNALRKLIFHLFSMHDYTDVKNGYTFFSSINDNYKHVSFKKVETTYIEHLLKDNTFIHRDETALYLPMTPLDYKNYCFAGKKDEESYNSYISYNYVIQKAKEIGIKTVYVKFHPSFIATKDEKLITEESNKIRMLCKQDNIQCIILGKDEKTEFINSLPAELLIKILKIKTLLTHDSTTGFNVTELDSNMRTFLFLSTLPHNHDYLKDINHVNPKIECL